MKDEMDILREVGKISAAHGSIALSEMLERRIELDMPHLEMLSYKEILTKVPSDQIMVCVFSHILTGLSGQILFVLSEKNAFKLVDVYNYSKPQGILSGSFTEMGLSLIKEVGSIVISSYLGALSIMSRRLIIPSIPTLVNGLLSEIMNMVVSKHTEQEYILVIEAIFRETKEEITGSFYLILTPESMEEIRSTCKKMLDELKS